MRLFNGDCVDFMKNEVADKSIDLIVTDPPYRIMARGLKSTTTGGMLKTDLTSRGKIFEHNDVNIKDYATEFYRILKDDCHCYVMTNNYNLIAMLNEFTNAGFKFIRSLIWDKQSKICGAFYMGQFEYILMFRKFDPRIINNCSTPDILSVPIKKLKDADGNNLHDTEKPVDLMKILIENSTNEGELVLDPFMGIGAAGVAAIQLKRDFIGCEIDKRYFDIAERRIEEANEIVEISDLDFGNLI